MPKQIAVRLPDELLEAVDRLVADGRFSSRSGAARAGLGIVVRQAERDAVDRAFADGFARRPEESDELADARRLAIEAIKDESWEPWWEREGSSGGARRPIRRGGCFSSSAGTPPLP